MCEYEMQDLYVAHRRQTPWPDFEPEGTLALKPWFASTRGITLPKDLDLPEREMLALDLSLRHPRDLVVGEDVRAARNEPERLHDIIERPILGEETGDARLDPLDQARLARVARQDDHA